MHDKLFDTYPSIDVLIATEQQRLESISTMKLVRKATHIGYRDSQELFPGKRGRDAAPTIQGVVSKWYYPLHFVAAEIYEKGNTKKDDGINFILIALTCASLDHDDNLPTTTSWIWDEKDSHGLALIKSLMAHIGVKGTSLIWLPKLADFLSALNTYHRDSDKALQRWTHKMLGKNKVAGKMIDLNSVIHDFYFNPFLPGKSNFQKNFENLEKSTGRKYSMKELHDIMEKGYFAPNSLNTHERKLKAGYLVDYTHTQIHPDLISQEKNEIEPYLEQLIFGSADRRKDITEKIEAYNRIKALQMVGWYQYWLREK